MLFTKQAQAQAYANQMNKTAVLFRSEYFHSRVGFHVFFMLYLINAFFLLFIHV